MSSVRISIVVALLATVVAIILLAVVDSTPAAQNEPVAPAPEDVESFEDAVRQTRERAPDERPAASGEVAVLDLTLDAEGRELRGAQVDRVQVVSANPPKVFARSRGSWEVRLLGRQPQSYRIPNPLDDIEIENPADAPSPFSQVRPTGSFPFQLIVPLTRDGSSLGVDRIQLVDMETGRIVVDTPVRR